MLRGCARRFSSCGEILRKPPGWVRQRGGVLKKITPLITWLNAFMISRWRSIRVKVARMKYKQLLIVIVLGAILLRLPIAFVMGDQVTVLPGIHDQVSYDALAHSVLAGQGYSF